MKRRHACDLNAFSVRIHTYSNKIIFLTFIPRPHEPEHQHASLLYGHVGTRWVLSRSPSRLED